MCIRNGTHGDIERCIDLSENFYETTAYIEHVPLDRESCAEYFNLSVDQEILTVLEKAGEVVGFALIIAAPFPMNKNYLIGVELAWWIEPEHRNGSAGLRLLKHVEDNAKAAGVKMLSMMSMEASMPDKIHKLYTHAGFKHEESTYLKVM